MPFEVRIHSSVPTALNKLGLASEFEQQVRRRIIDELQNAPELAGERVDVPVPYIIYPMYFADPDPYSTAIHEFSLYVNQPDLSVRNLLSFAHRIIDGPS